MAPDEIETLYQNAPDTLRAEILNGELILQPRPVPAHAYAAGELYAQLRPFGRSDGWVFLQEPELHLEGDRISPDIAGWRVERFLELGLAEQAAITERPDWIAEVVSPKTAKRDRGDKRELYAAAGVAHYWVVDHRVQQIEVYEFCRGLDVVPTVFDTAFQPIPPFAALIDMRALWITNLRNR